MKSRRHQIIISYLVLFFLILGCRKGGTATEKTVDNTVSAPAPQPTEKAQVPKISPIKRVKVAGIAAQIVAGAKIQENEAAIYTPGYFSLTYPNGDLPRNQGVCTDVVVRALRHAGYDLQKLMHEDMKANFSKYPTKWGLKRPDKNIDHRRVPNHMCFLERFGQKLPLDKDWQPGDLIYWALGGGLEHCGVVSDGFTASGRPLIIHNIDICREEDCFNAWKITGHFRYPKAP